MSKHCLIVKLKGGLGNQLFQYAASRALAHRNDISLIIDGRSGFYRDKVFRRSYSLNYFRIKARMGMISHGIPFFYERFRERIGLSCKNSVFSRVWWDFIHETRYEYIDEVYNYKIKRDTYIDGYWESESYFRDCRDLIAFECSPPEPGDDKFLLTAREMESCNSVAVGVRIFEESSNLDEAKRILPLFFYEQAAKQMIGKISNPVFFVFCSNSKSIRDKLNLPGEIRYITPDDGYGDSVSCLWLFSRCQHQIISNSSFFWWGAWLAEYSHPGALIISCNLFVNRDAVPNRWINLLVKS